jgi:(p)ppGpp synthase/HD superfamily hydrolase
MSKPAYGERFDQAVALAVSAFRDKWRKDAHVPYVTHLLAVCATVGEWGGDEDQMIAAVLHDYLEDVDGATFEELERRFGSRVAGFVRALSDTEVRPKPPWKQRKLAHLADLRTESPDLKLISAADKLHNARSVLRDYYTVGVEVFDRFTAPMDETLWYYREVYGALSENWRHPILEDLRDAVRDMHRVAGRPWV